MFHCCSSFILLQLLIFNYMASFLESVAGVGGIIDFVQKGLNLFQDATGYDYSQQDWLNQQNSKRQFENQLNLMFQQQDFNKDLMGVQNEYNKELAQQQYLYNSRLSDLSRNIIAMRNNGLNPAAMGSLSNPSGSVSLPSSSIAQGATPSAGFGSASPVAHVSTSHESIADILLKNSQEKKNRSEANKIDIENKYVEDQQLADLKLKRQELKNKIETENLTKVERDKVQKEIDDLESQIKFREQDIKLREKTNEIRDKEANAAVKNAESRQKEVEAEVRYKEIMGKVNQTLANSTVKLNDQQVNQLDALAKKLSAEAELTEKQADKYVELIGSTIFQNYAQGWNAWQHGQLAQKDVKWYEVKMAVDMLDKVVDDIAQFLPFSQATKLLKSVEKVKKVTYNKNGQPTVTTETTRSVGNNYGKP